MYKKIRFYLKSTFVRYMVSYVLIVMLLVTCLTVYMYAYYRRSISANIEQSEINKLASVRYQNERNLTALDNAVSDLRSFSADSPDVWAEIISRLVNGNDFIDQIFVRLSGESDTIYSNGHISADDFASSVSFENAEEADIQNLFFAGETVILPHQTVESRLNNLPLNRGRYIVLAYPLEESGTAVFLLPETAFQPMLDDEINAGRSRYILCNGSVLAAGWDAQLSDKSVETVAREVTDTETARERIAGRDYLVITMPGNAMNLTYLAVVPTGKINAAAASGWIGFVAILLIFALPCVIITILISRLNYRPIREMSSRFRSEFEADADEIQTIRAGITDLDQQLNSSIPARRIQFVQNLVRGKYATREEAVSDALPLEIRIDRPYYCVLLLGSPREGHTDVYLESVLKSAPENVSATGTDLLALDQILILGFADEVSSLLGFANRICALECVKTARVSVAVSDIHDSFSEIPTAYLEANSAYENRFVMGESRLLSFKDISFAARNVAPQARAFVEAVKQAVASGDVIRTNEQLDELLIFLRGGDMSLFAFRQIYNDVISALISLKRSPSGEDGLKSYDLFTLSNCRSIDELDEILRKVCADIIEESRESEEHPLIQDIIAFMTQSYTDPDFSLTAVAEKFSLSTTRLSVEFKENMHMTPSDYLTMLRMEHAKKLLKKTERSIKDICADAGYSDVSSFIRRFKQYSGITPLQYRQSAKEAETEEENRDS